ncbi:hypothetical protein HKX48_006342 [Thoreauomyces humboldtii]|nr:hypothetical protein HKX48_006342 [Thoreauomyces humboldtii]
MRGFLVGPVLSLLLLLATGEGTSAASSPACKTYTIQPGDSCTSIAGKFSITIPTLNGYCNCCNDLEAGNSICVSPGTLQAPPTTNADGSCVEVQVQSGQNCYSIAMSHPPLTQALIQSINPDINCNLLSPGAWLCVTQGTKPDRRPKPDAKGFCAPYTVVKDDSCSSLAAANGISNDDIDHFNQQTFAWNGCQNLQIGAHICLSTGTPPAPTIIPGLQCGAQSQNGSTCPLNVCCDKWGWCGQTEEFCKVVPGPPGNGCQSNCGMTAPPSSVVCTDTMKYTVGYWSSWATTRPCQPYFPEDIDPRQWTHLHYAFGVVDATGQVNVDDTGGNYTMLDRLVALKNTAPSLKVVLSVGGWSFQNVGPTQDRFKNMVATQASRATFIKSCLSLFTAHKVDGLDIDWEYPATPERSGIFSDTDNYLAFVKEARAAFGTQYTLSVAAPSGYWYLRGYKIAEMSPFLDYIVFMLYDLHGNWDASIPSLGPYLNAHNNMTEITTSITMMQKAGVPSNKILMGLGFYGRTFLMSDPTCTAAGTCTFQNPGGIDPTIDDYVNTALAGPCTGAGGILAYYELQAAANHSKVMEWVDKDAMANILVYNTDNWGAYETGETLLMKVAAAKEMCLGGVVVWAVDLDDNENSLANALSGTGLGQSQIVDMSGMNSFVQGLSSLQILPNTFFDDLMTAIGPIITTQDYSMINSQKLIMNGCVAMLNQLLTLMQDRFDNNVIAANTKPYITQMENVLFSKGLQYFTCTGPKGKISCPTAMPGSTDSDVGGNVAWTCTDQASFSKLLQPFGIDPQNLAFADYSYNLDNCSGGLRRRFAGGGQICIPIRRKWTKFPTITTSGTKTNDYAAYAYNIYKKSEDSKVQDFLNAHILSDMKPFFSCNPGPCSSTPFKTVQYTVTDSNGLNSFMSQQLGVSPSDFTTSGTIKNSGQPEIASQCGRFGTNCGTPGYTLNGVPQMSPNWPENPQPNIVSFMTNCRTLINTANTLIGQTDVSLNSTRDNIKALTMQLGVANQTLQSMVQYETATETAVAADEKKRKNFLEAIISAIVGLVLAAILPGAGEVLDAAIGAFTTIRLAAEAGDLGSDIADFATTAGKWADSIGDAGANAANVARDMFEALPDFLKTVIGFAKNAFDQLGTLVKCAATQYIDGEVQSSIEDALPDFGVARRSLSPLASPPSTTRLRFPAAVSPRASRTTLSSEELDELWSLAAMPRVPLPKHVSTHTGYLPQPSGDIILSIRGGKRKKSPNVAASGAQATKKQKRAKGSGSDPTANDKPDCVFQTVERQLSTSSYDAKCKSAGGAYGFFGATPDAALDTLQLTLTPYDGNNRKDVDDVYESLGGSRWGYGTNQKKGDPNLVKFWTQCDHSLEVNEVSQMIGKPMMDKMGSALTPDALCALWKEADSGSYAAHLNDVKGCINGADNMRQIARDMNQIKVPQVQNGEGFGAAKASDANILGTLTYLGLPDFVDRRTKTAKCLSDALKKHSKLVGVNVGEADKAQAESLSQFLSDKGDDVVSTTDKNLVEGRKSMRTKIAGDRPATYITDSGDWNNIEKVDKVLNAKIIASDALWKETALKVPADGVSAVEKYKGFDDPKFRNGDPTLPSGGDPTTDPNKPKNGGPTGGSGDPPPSPACPAGKARRDGGGDCVPNTPGQGTPADPHDPGSNHPADPNNHSGVDGSIEGDKGPFGDLDHEPSRGQVRASHGGGVGCG